MITKRTRFILSIIAVALLVAGGVVYGLAKTGKINIQYFADVVGIQSQSASYTLTIMAGYNGQSIGYDGNNRGLTADLVPANSPNTPPMIVHADDRAVSYTHLRAHETDSYLVCRLL